MVRCGNRGTRRTGPAAATIRATGPTSVAHSPVSRNGMAAVMAAWDSTSRKGSRAAVFHAATPTGFRRWLRGTVEHESRQQGERVVFINAWNEWAEGAYLEPDTDFGCGYLEAVASAANGE
jgi:hypothetical protein